MTPTLKRISRRLQSWISPVYAVMICMVIAICIFFSDIPHGRKIGCPPWAALMLCGAAFFLCLLCVCSLCFRKPIPKRFLLPTALVLMILQMIAVYQYYFYTDWDITALMELSSAIAHCTDKTTQLGYFSTYPNNLFLVWLFSVIERAAHAVGLHELEYYVILCVQCLFSAATGVLLFFILEKLFHDSRLSAFGYVLYLLLVGLSPWVSIPYSDSVGLLFPTLILFLYLYRNRAKYRWIPWTAIAFLSWIGYKIKPQILILLIAIGIIRLLVRLRTEKPVYCVRWLSAFAAGAVCAVLLTNSVISGIDLPLNREKTFGIQHFFMMGLNPDAYGVWAEEDVAFSAAYPTERSRSRADMDRAYSRIRQMGPGGIIQQITRKTLTNYHDGSFCWAGEGTFFSEILPEKNPALSRFFRSLYYTRSQAETGVNFSKWFNFEQMIWSTVLLCGVFAALGRKNEDRDLIMLTIIGLTLFELLFEARARYLYIYAPFYILLAVYGVRECRSGVLRLLKKNGAVNQGDGRGLPARQNA